MSSETKPKYYLTTPIYYVNARPHIGHAYTTIVADVLARRHRLLGEDVFFLTGTDEHGQKIERSAAAAGIPPQQFADEVSAQFRTLWDRMGLTYDRYIRTTDPVHKQGAQKLFQTLYDRGYIYLSTYTGAYCVSDEAFVDLPVGTPCPDCGRLLEEVTEENFFFKLSEFQQPLIELIESGKLSVEPESRRNEVLSFLRGGLKDLSVSRSSFTWGIPVPEEVQKSAGVTQKHIIYVWLDALSNYITAIGYGATEEQAQAEFAKYWPADLQLVGKEIIRFHCVYWPAFLLAAGLPTPKAITAHGWLLFDNSKMSKSKGNIVRTETILQAFGDEVYGRQFPEATPRERDLFASDVLRYFLLREIPFGQDGSFSFDAFITRYNADLANGYGNLVSRTLKMVEKYFNGIIPDPQVSDHPEFIKSRLAFHSYLRSITRKEQGYVDEVEDFESIALSAKLELADFSSFLQKITRLIGITDQFLTDESPWKPRSGESDDSRLRRLAGTLYSAVEDIRFVTALLHPVIPFATSKVWEMLAIDEPLATYPLTERWWGQGKPRTKLGPLAPIFPRADKGLAQIMSDMENTERPASPLKQATTPAHAAPVPHDPTHPAAPPRAIESLDEPSGMLPVAGSTAHTSGPDATPSHAQASASGIFAGQPPAAEGPADASPQITIDDFAKVELRVAEVKTCERIPKADKLLKLEVDLGYERRQILSGIAEHYAPEDLVGRRIIVITNLAPRKMRGLDSHGMLLAASGPVDGPDGGKPILATVGEGVPLGTRLK